MNFRSSVCVSAVARALKSFSTRHAVMLGVLFLGLSSLAFAQEATVVGTVTDPSGSAIPGAKITVTSVETAASRTIQTSESGQYVVPDLRIGHYDMKVEAAGFKTAEQKDVVRQHVKT